jgi:hypothetical protein
MTRDEQKAFVDELITRVKITLLSRLRNVPEEWDGHELRVWIADKFTDAAYLSKLQDKRSKRRRDYENEVLVRNL